MGDTNPSHRHHQYTHTTTRACTHHHHTTCTGIKSGQVMNFVHESRNEMLVPTHLTLVLHITEMQNNMLTHTRIGMSIIPIFCPKNWHSHSTLVVEGLYHNDSLLYFLMQLLETTNTECIERLCDLLTTSCRKTEVLLQNEIDRIIVGSSIRFVLCVFVVVCHTHNTHHSQHAPLTYRKRFFNTEYNGKITKRNFEGLSTDSKPRYLTLYEDGDEEELYAEEILPLLTDPGSTPLFLFVCSHLLFVCRC